MRVFAAALLGLVVAAPAGAEQPFAYKQLGDTSWISTDGAAPKQPRSPATL